MKLLAIIPARGGSKGVPRKNIKLLGDKPLLWYTYQAAKSSNLFDEILLSTDDEEIASIGKEIGFMVPFLRPIELATDAAKSIDVVIHTLNELQKSNRTYDAVILLQPTSPFREKGIINKSFDIFIKTGADSLVSVKKVPHQFNPHWVFKVNENNFLSISTGDEELISRRQELPDAYYRDGQIYITTVEVLLNQKAFTGKKLAYLLNTYEGADINIDAMDDWEKAEEFIMNYTKQIEHE